MVLQIGEMEYSLQDFSININKVFNNGEYIFQQRLHLNFQNIENINGVELSSQILDNYNKHFKIISSNQEYNFTNYVFEGVNIDIREDSIQTNVMFSQNMN